MRTSCPFSGKKVDVVLIEAICNLTFLTGYYKRNVDLFLLFVQKCVIYALIFLGKLGSFEPLFNGIVCVKYTLTRYLIGTQGALFYVDFSIHN